MTTSEHFNQRPLTLCAEDSPAKTLAKRAKAKASQANVADCGTTCCGLFAKYDHDSQSWRTWPHCESEDSRTCSVDFPASGLMLNGFASTQHSLEHLISGEECSLWVGTLTRCDALGTKGRSLRFQTKTPTPTELAGGKVNPTWAEWLMGFPKDWTLIDG